MFGTTPEKDIHSSRVPLPIEVYLLISEAHERAHIEEYAECSLISWPNGTLMHICKAAEEAKQIVYN